MWLTASSPWIRTITLPWSQNSCLCVSFCTMHLVRPASVDQNNSHWSYGRRWSPTLPTPSTKPGGGFENTRPKLCGDITLFRCKERLDGCVVSHPMSLSSLSLFGARTGVQLLPSSNVIRDLIFRFEFRPSTSPALLKVLSLTSLKPYKFS